MEDYSEENDLEVLLGGDDERYTYGDVSGDSGDEAIEDNSHNHEETGGDGVVGPSTVKKEKKIVRNPQPKLNFEALQGPKGLLALNKLFNNHKFRGSGHEKEDLAGVLEKLEQWSFRLFPKFHFEDSLKRMESLGKKREVQVYLRKIRNGVFDDDVVRQLDDDDDDEVPPVPPVDAFDDLLTEQLHASSAFDEMLSEQVAATQATPRPVPAAPVLTQEQLERIERNRKLALERRMQQLSQLTTTTSSADRVSDFSSGSQQVAAVVDISQDSMEIASATPEIAPDQMEEMELD